MLSPTMTPRRGIGMVRLWLALTALLFATPAFGQAIEQSGAATAFHVPVFVANGIVTDGGTISSPAISNLGVFSGTACPLGVSSQTTPGQSLSPYTQFQVC